MKISRLLHAAILVTDLPRARQFYEELLGLTEKPRADFDFNGIWYDLGDCELHLMVTDEPLASAEARPRRDYHVAFMIDDYATTKQFLVESGIAFREGRHAAPQLFVRDPDGNLIELQQNSRAK